MTAPGQAMGSMDSFGVANLGAVEKSEVRSPHPRATVVTRADTIPERLAADEIRDGIDPMERRGAARIAIAKQDLKVRFR